MSKQPWCCFSNSQEFSSSTPKSGKMTWPRRLAIGGSQKGTSWRDSLLEAGQSSYPSPGSTTFKKTNTFHGAKSSASKTRAPKLVLLLWCRKVSISLQSISDPLVAPEHRHQEATSALRWMLWTLHYKQMGYGSFQWTELWRPNIALEVSAEKPTNMSKLHPLSRSKENFISFCQVPSFTSTISNSSTTSLLWLRS